LNGVPLGLLRGSPPDMPVASDHHGNGSQRSGSRQPVCGQPGLDPVEIGFELAQLPPFLAPFRRMSEDVEDGAAQCAQGRKHTKTRHHPWTEAGFARAAVSVLPSEDGRREMELEPVVTLELEASWRANEPSV
jgi:hypothetical protein